MRLSDFILLLPAILGIRFFWKGNGTNCVRVFPQIAINYGVFRQTKPYFKKKFDNENIVASSAMGQKRLILSSYIKYGFESIGFEYITNIPWDKGEIEGKRAYNSGNNTPYYQSPLNCWEHMMIFRKSSQNSSECNWEKVLKCKPVHKMVKGVNKFGHTAPFPPEIPQIIISQLSSGDSILDPFAGSGTTGVAAIENGQHFILCEALEEYASLIKRRLDLSD